MGKMVEDLKLGDHGYMTVTERALSKYGDQLTCVTITRHCYHQQNDLRIIKEDNPIF